jgi:hypothetical protein
MLPAARPVQIGGNLLSEQAPTRSVTPRKWEEKAEKYSDVAGVAGTPQPDCQLIRSFPNLCQFDNEWAANMRRMAQFGATSPPQRPSERH